MTRNLRNIEGMPKEDLVPDYKYYAKILTKNTDLPSLSALDAGDVVECYALTRMAKLENGDSSSPFNLLVRKTAIAFRYKPKSSSPDAVVKEPFELTLEYGPQRTGSTQSFEAMPSVNGHLRDLEYEDGDGMYVSWENHGELLQPFLVSLFDILMMCAQLIFVFYSANSENILQSSNFRGRLGWRTLHGTHHRSGS